MASNRDVHCKVYVEKELHDRIKEYQESRAIESFSMAGRELWLVALGMPLNKN